MNHIAITSVIGARADSIIEKVWDIGLASGANILALNVIEAAFTDDTIVQRRDALNALIADHEQDRWWVKVVFGHPSGHSVTNLLQVYYGSLPCCALFRSGRGKT